MNTYADCRHDFITASDRIAYCFDCDRVWVDERIPLSVSYVLLSGFFTLSWIAAIWAVKVAWEAWA